MLYFDIEKQTYYVQAANSQFYALDPFIFIKKLISIEIDVDLCEIIDCINHYYQSAEISLSQRDDLILILKDDIKTYQEVYKIAPFIIVKKYQLASFNFKQTMNILRRFPIQVELVYLIIEILVDFNYEQIQSIFSAIHAEPFIVGLQNPDFFEKQSELDQINILLFFITLNVNVDNFIKIDIKTRIFIQQLKIKLNGKSQSKHQEPEILQNNIFYQNFQEYFNQQFIECKLLIDLSSINIYLLLQVKNTKEELQFLEKIGPYIIEYVLTKEIQFVQFQSKSYSLKILQFCPPQLFYRLFQQIMQQHSQGDKKQISQRFSQFTNQIINTIDQDQFIIEILKYRQQLPRQDIINVFKKLHDLEQFEQELLEFLYYQRQILPISVEVKSMKLNILKIISNEYKDLFFELIYPKQLEQQFIQVINKLHITQQDIQLAYCYIKSIFKEKSIITQSQLPNLSIEQAISAIFILLYREFYLYDDDQLKTDDFKILQANNSPLSPLDINYFEQIFIHNNLHAGNSAKYGYFISKASLLSLCAFNDQQLEQFQLQEQYSQHIFYPLQIIEQLLNVIFQARKLDPDNIINVEPVISVIIKESNFIPFTKIVMLNHTLRHLKIHISQFNYVNQYQLININKHNTQAIQNLQIKQELSENKTSLDLIQDAISFRQLKANITTVAQHDYFCQLYFQQILKHIDSFNYIQPRLSLATNEVLTYLNMVLCDLQDYLKYSCKIAESVLLFPLKLFVFVNNIYCDLLQTSQIQWNDKNKGMLIFDKNSLFLQLDIVNSLYISQCQQVLQLLYLCYNNQQFLKQLLKRISYSQIEANNLQECLIQIIKNTKSPQILFTYSRYPECLISLKEALLGSFSAELLQEPSFNAVPLSQQYQPQIFKRIKDLDLTVKYIVQCQFLIQRILSYDPDCSCFDGCVILNQKGRFIYNINETSDNEKNVISLFLQTWFGGKNYCNIEDIPVFIIDKDNVQSNELISTLTEEEEFSHTSQMRKYTELDMMIFGILLGAEWKIYKNGTIDKGIFCCQ